MKVKEIEHGTECYFWDKETPEDKRKDLYSIYSHNARGGGHKAIGQIGNGFDSCMSVVEYDLLQKRE